MIFHKFFYKSDENWKIVHEITQWMVGDFREPDFNFGTFKALQLTP